MLLALLAFVGCDKGSAEDTAYDSNLTGRSESSPLDDSDGSIDDSATEDTSDTYTPSDCENGLPALPLDRSMSVCVDFEEATESFHLDDGRTDHFRVIVTDVNGDGYEDLYIINQGSPDQLYQNSETVFLDVSSDLRIDFGGDNYDAEFVDYDGDGDLDLFTAGASGLKYYNFNGDYFEDGVELTSEGAYVMTWLDDGLLVDTNVGLQYYVYDDSAESFHNIIDETDLEGVALEFAVSDLDADGDDDLVIAGPSENEIYINNGDHQFVASGVDLGLNGSDVSYDVDLINVADSDIPMIFITNNRSDDQLYRWNEDEGLFEDVAFEFGVLKESFFAGIILDKDSISQWPIGLLGTSLGEEEGGGALGLYLAQPDGSSLETLSGFEEMGSVFGFSTGVTSGLAWVNRLSSSYPDFVVIQNGALVFYENTSENVKVE